MNAKQRRKARRAGWSMEGGIHCSRCQRKLAGEAFRVIDSRFVCEGACELAPHKHERPTST